MSTNRRGIDRWAAIVLPAIWVAIAIALLNPRPTVTSAADGPATAALAAASLMTDDGFYYLRISENLARRRGSTFDTVHPTNGYHPLWLVALVPVHWLADGREAVLLADFALQLLLLAGASICLYHAARAGMGPGSALVAVLVWIVAQSGYWPGLSGMEFALQSLLISLLLLETVRLTTPQPPGGPIALRLGAILALAFLARLDNGLLGLAVLLFLTQSVPRVRRQLWTAGVALGVTVVAYAAVNAWLFASALPVSGLLKRDWSNELLAQDPVYLEHGWIAAKVAYLRWPLTHWPGTEALLFLVGTLGACFVLAAARRRPLLLAPTLARALSPFAFFAVLQAAFYVVIYHGGYSFQPWYFATQSLLAGLVVGAASEAGRRWLLARRGPGSRVAAVLFVASLALAVGLRVGWAVEQHRRQPDPIQGGPLYSTASWIDEHLPASTTLGAWNAGILSYFSRVRVINLDGLVNSTDFRRRRMDLCRYWREERIDYLADVFERHDPFAHFADRARDCLDDLELLWLGPSYPDSDYGAAVYRIARQTSEATLDR